MDERQSLTETEIKDCIHALVQSMESQDSERFKPVISAVMDKYPAEKMGPEEFSVLLGYDVAEKLLMQLAYKYFPEAKKNAKIRFTLLNYSFMELHLRHLVQDVHGSMICCADCSRWLIKEYLRYLKGDIHAFDMTISDDCYWKPNFGTGAEWIQFCLSLEKLWYGMPREYIEARSTLEHYKPTTGGDHDEL